MSASSPETYVNTALVSPWYASKPSGKRPAIGVPGGKRSRVRLRGIDSSAVRPLASWMLTRIIVSVRIPHRPGPASPPSSRMLVIASGSTLTPSSAPSFSGT